MAFVAATSILAGYTGGLVIVNNTNVVVLACVGFQKRSSLLFDKHAKIHIVGAGIFFGTASAMPGKGDATRLVILATIAFKGRLGILIHCNTIALVGTTCVLGNLASSAVVVGNACFVVLADIGFKRGMGLFPHQNARVGIVATRILAGYAAGIAKVGNACEFVVLADVDFKARLRLVAYKYARTHIVATCVVRGATATVVVVGNTILTITIARVSL